MQKNQVSVNSQFGPVVQGGEWGSFPATCFKIGNLAHFSFKVLSQKIWGIMQQYKGAVLAVLSHPKSYTMHHSTTNRNELCKNSPEISNNLLKRSNNFPFEFTVTSKSSRKLFFNNDLKRKKQYLDILTCLKREKIVRFSSFLFLREISRLQAQFLGMKTTPLKKNQKSKQTSKGNHASQNGREKK